MSEHNTPGPTMGEFITEMNEASSDKFTKPRAFKADLTDEEAKIMHELVHELGSKCSRVLTHILTREPKLIVHYEGVMISLFIKVATAAISIIAEPKTIDGLAKEVAWGFEQSLKMELTHAQEIRRAKGEGR